MWVPNPFGDQTRGVWGTLEKEQRILKPEPTMALEHFHDFLPGTHVQKEARKRIRDSNKKGASVTKYNMGEERGRTRKAGPGGDGVISQLA